MRRLNQLAQETHLTARSLRSRFGERTLSSACVQLRVRRHPKETPSASDPSLETNESGDRPAWWSRFPSTTRRRCWARRKDADNVRVTTLEFLASGNRTRGPSRKTEVDRRRRFSKSTSWSRMRARASTKRRLTIVSIGTRSEGYLNCFDSKWLQERSKRKDELVAEERVSLSSSALAKGLHTG